MKQRRVWILAAVTALLLAAGCGGPKELLAPERFAHGYVVVLPGVEGSSTLNRSVAQGLADGGVQGAIEVHDWTLGPGWMSAVINLRAQSHNRLEASKIAEKIVQYQNKHPGRPVHIIGHSGGGGIAVYVLESLPPRRKVTSAILLAPALSPGYDLRPALRHVERGIYNFYSPYDVGFLGLGTSVAGTIDGRHTRAAGAVGFTMPSGLGPDDTRLYTEKLHQQRYMSKMAESGHPGTHVGWANRRFVAEWLAPTILKGVSQTVTAQAEETQPADP